MEHSPPISIPRLRTPRLLLREYRKSDFDMYAAHVSDPRVTAFITPLDRRKAWWSFASGMGQWVLQGIGWWAIELVETGETVGNVGAFFRETWPEVEVGWNTFHDHWGKGFATEAAREVVRFLFEVRQEKRITAIIDAGNKASLRVAEHLGMAFDGETELFGKPLARWAIARG